MKSTLVRPPISSERPAPCLCACGSSPGVMKHHIKLAFQSWFRPGRMNRFKLTALLILICLGSSVWAEGTNTVTFDGQKLAGRLNNFPLQDFLQELAFRAHFEIQTESTLNQAISIDFTGQSLIEGIRDTMRRAGLSYVLIQTQPEGPDFPTIQTLLIFDSPGAPSPAKIDTQTEDEPSELTDPFAPQEVGPRLPPAAPGSDKLEPNSTAGIEFEGSRKDLEDFVKSLAEDESLSKDEYEMIMQKIQDSLEKTDS